MTVKGSYLSAWELAEQSKQYLVEKHDLGSRNFDAYATQEFVKLKGKVSCNMVTVSSTRVAEYDVTYCT